MEDEVIGLPTPLSMVVALLIVEVAVAEAVLSKLFQLRFGRIKHTTTEVTELRVHILQSQHLAELKGLDDPCTFVHPTLDEHVDTLGVAVMTREDNLLAERGIAKAERQQALCHLAVNLQQCVFFIDTCIFRNIDITEVRYLQITTPICGLIRYLYRN